MKVFLFKKEKIEQRFRFYTETNDLSENVIMAGINRFSEGDKLE